jgi:hypothetical protein
MCCSYVHFCWCSNFVCTGIPKVHDLLLFCQLIVTWCHITNLFVTDFSLGGVLSFVFIVLRSVSVSWCFF